MYIEPNTDIGFISECPLDPTYNHTLYWDSEAQQYGYFLSKVKYLAVRQSYQRVNKGKIRIGITADQLYDCNYLMFRNTAYGNKWFYAFIQSVEYLNNGASEVTYVLDVMQTWFFDYTLKPSYVEREHTTNDDVGANTVPENLEQGPYYVAKSGLAFDDDPELLVSRFLLFRNTTPSGSPVTGTISNGIYSALDVMIFMTAEELGMYIQEATTNDKLGGIVAIYNIRGTFTSAGSRDTSVSIAKNYGNFGGYSPKNAKLFCYPYNVLHLYSAAGSADYRYEQFSGSSCTFSVKQVSRPEPFTSIAPTNYNGYSGNDLELRLVYANFPTSPFNNDVYKQYLAANANSLNLQQTTNTIEGIFGLSQAAVGGALALSGMGAQGGSMAQSGVQTGISAFMKSAQLNARLEDIKSKPAQTNGSSTPSTEFALGLDIPHYKCLKIKAEYARIIDDYFTMYGYAIRRVKVPNRNARPHWTFTKTAGCVVVGSVPADDIRSICSIYDNGITFWKKPDEVGDYTLDNRPGGVG